MKIIKRGQLAVISVALMIMVAAYVNYRYNPEREKDLGQTVFVNGKDTFSYNAVDIYKEQNTASDETVKTSGDDIVNEKGDVLATFKHQRDSMFSELTDNYNKVINNENTKADQVNDYQNKLNDLIQKKHNIAMVEEIIKANGIEDLAIVPTNGNINVIIKSDEELGKDKIASIQSTVQDEFKVDAKQITISCKKST